MTSGPITSWQIVWEKMETVGDFIFWGSKTILGGDCSHEIKRRLLLGGKVIINLDSILQRRDITLSTKVRLVKAIGEGNGTPLQYSCLENPMDGGAWKAAVHGVAEGRTPLSDFSFIFSFMHWRSKWQPTPVLLPGESQGRGSLVGSHVWGCTESDMTKVT